MKGNQVIMNESNKTILVLEDEHSLMEVIKAKLELEGFSVVTTRSVGQTLDYLKEGVEVDAIWLDHYLFGKEDGLDFVAELKKDRFWKDIPVFVVANTVSPEKIRLYLELGVQGCYTKVDHRLDKIISDLREFLEVN